MEADETCFLNAKKCLDEKIDNARIKIASIDDSFLSAFVEHGKEVIQKAGERLSDAEFTKNPTTRKVFYRQAWFYLDLLSQQIETIKLVEESQKDSRWKILWYLISTIANEMRLDLTPLPLFGYSYYSTGSFIYSSYGLEVTKPVYQISVDTNDSILFWPLAAHEIGHCKLTQIDIKSIEKRLKEFNLLDEVYIKRVKESLCDGIAAGIFGPSYLLAFVTLNWAVGPSTNEYPNQDFRIKLISETLKKCGWSIPQEFTNIISIDERVSEKEEIHPLFDDIIEISITSASKSTDNSFVNFDLFSSTSSASLDVLFNAGWLKFIKNPEKIREISEKVREHLERRAGSS